MKPLTTIKHLNVIDDIKPGFILCEITLLAGSFCLNGMKETFDNCIISTIAFTVHTVDSAVLSYLKPLPKKNKLVTDISGF